MFGRFIQMAKHYPVLSMLLSANLIFYLLLSLPVFPRLSLYQSLSGINLYIADGEWWRLITPIFLHSSFEHVMFNCVALYILGEALESSIGSVRLLLLFVCTGIIANIITYLVHPLTYIHVGASGSLYGLLGFYLFFSIFKKSLLSRQKRIMIYSLAIVGIILTFIQPGINHTGHLGGLAAGLLIAPLLSKKAAPLW
ncbi:rhomboid family intramembrane serine protease [Peribacillus sp. SCS-155]|uniref:rhomboid family intramembrane serine protease n=1 Tax=Peribacillus sedimenti TaxID=3115297 RepID=UPI003905FFB5